MDDSAKKRNLFYYLLVFGLLFLTWVVFSEQMDGFHLTLGVISCGFVTWLSADLVFDDRNVGVLERATEAWRMFGYIAWLLLQIVLSNFHLLKLTFSKQSALQPQIIRHKTTLKSDFEKFMLANSITLTPGTVTIKIIGDTFYIHAIDDFTAKGIDGEMERRIAKIFN